MFANKNSKKSSVLVFHDPLWIAGEFTIYTFYFLFSLFCYSVIEYMSAKMVLHVRGRKFP